MITLLRRHRGPLARWLLAAGIAVPVLIAAIAFARYRGDWPSQRFLLVYTAPLIAFGAAWARSRLRVIDTLPDRVVLLDLAAFVLGAVRIGGSAMLPYSGHMLFLTYVAITAASARWRWLAVCLIAMTTWFKLVLWHDRATWLGGLLLGLALALVSLATAHRVRALDSAAGARKD